MSGHTEAWRLQRDPVGKQGNADSLTSMNHQTTFFHTILKDAEECCLCDDDNEIFSERRSDPRTSVNVGWHRNDPNGPEDDEAFGHVWPPTRTQCVCTTHIPPLTQIIQTICNINELVWSEESPDVCCMSELTNVQLLIWWPLSLSLTVLWIT